MNTDQAVRQTVMAMRQTALETGGEQFPAVVVMASSLMLALALGQCPDPDELADRMVNDCLREHGLPWRLVRQTS